ncbi:MAG: alanine dehydrogenase [Planctomycetota bacterium]
MKVGIPKEIKPYEYRVSMLPVGVEELRKRGHEVRVERNAGSGSGIADVSYEQAGATIVESTKEVWDWADMIVKVKEPVAEEYPRLREGLVLFTYFHFAAAKPLFDAVVKSKIEAVAYETIRAPNGSLPCLTPMSEVAGRMSIQQGAKYLEKPMEGRGILLSGVPGVAPAKVVVLGGGIVGTNAAKIAAGMGADVSILDVNLDRLRYLDDTMPPNVRTLFSNTQTVREQAIEADLLIGAVLLPGARAPVLVPESLVKQMKPGSVIVDVAIDQGGCIETIRPTTHGQPTYIAHGVVHYGVTNMPGAVGRTSTYALTNVTLPFAIDIATKGLAVAAKNSPQILSGINVSRGRVIHPAVAKTFGAKAEAYA